MSIFGGISGALNIATKALSFANPAMLGAQLFMGASSNIGDQLLQKVGDMLGLPQHMIDAAQAMFHQSFGDVQGAAQNWKEAYQGIREGMSATDNAAVDRQTNEGTDQLANQAISTLGDETSTEGKGSWLMALAKALGKILDAKAAKVEQLGNNLDKTDASKTAEFQAASQEFNLMMSTATNVLKTIGQGLSTMAKQ